MRGINYVLPPGIPGGLRCDTEAAFTAGIGERALRLAQSATAKRISRPATPSSFPPHALIWPRNHIFVSN